MVFNGTLHTSRTGQLSDLRRYFADNVRDDYAAGQLDAQVIDLGSLPQNVYLLKTDRLRVFYRR